MQTTQAGQRITYYTGGGKAHENIRCANVTPRLRRLNLLRRMAPTTFWQNRWDKTSFEAMRA
eukprot:4681017-Pyramimonas_sp.AAC.3